MICCRRSQERKENRVKIEKQEMMEINIRTAASRAAITRERAAAGPGGKDRRRAQNATVTNSNHLSIKK